MRHNRAEYELAIALATEKLREARGLSRSAVAEALEIPELEVTRMENGSLSLSAGGLMVLLSVFELGWQDFTDAVSEELPRAREQIERAAHHGQD